MTTLPQPNQDTYVIREGDVTISAPTEMGAYLLYRACVLGSLDAAAIIVSASIQPSETAQTLAAIQEAIINYNQADEG
jgi:hypothetical protein